ncbi:DUF86 domain-containing protein [Pleurocapsa sp. PCC 7319]|uniref:HepT-like ribonuclease domain-containing protein n=1 Tax=Pleurocapsa sp. PCC 7319 TaxID=118161 RepID=UPI00047586CF|nr:HepT-like ribonuclease domain-containing protein [Pleurocapsa sp. PCC 7319]
MNREKQFLLDMLVSARIAINYLQEKSIEDLENNLQLQDALIRRLLIIGEASKRISETTQQDLATIPWRLIKGMRNRLVHEYDDIDLDTIWETVNTSLPILVVELEKIVASYPDSGS